VSESERERIRYRAASGIAIGTFRARLNDPWFSNSGPTGAHLFVFPRTAVTITHAGERTVVADRNRVMFYNRQQHYARGAISRAGDLSDWFKVPAEAVADAASAYDPAVVDDPERPFRFVAGPCAATVYAQQRRVVLSSAGRAAGTDEAVLELLCAVVADAYRARGVAPARTSGRAARSRRDLVEAARGLCALHYRERVSLSEIADRLRVSPFHLSRVFKETTGTGLHQYVTQLRLRRALAHLEDPRCSLTEIALDLGFSSHSHFTAAFRQAFATSPSRLRLGWARSPERAARRA
jgi:AraC family transcriptional regulator